MTFWIRHLTLLILCMVLPLGAALYADKESEVSRAQRAGATAARLGEKSLDQSLRLGAHQTVGDAMVLARKISDADLAGDLSKPGKKKDAALETLTTLFNATSADFAWLVDAGGGVVFANGMTDVPESPRVIVGHPLFVRTQEGFALDGFWDEGGKLSIVGAAPVTKDGRADGAVMIARTIGPKLLTTLAKSLDAELTVVAGPDLIATTLDEKFAKQLAEQTANSLEAVHGGRLAEPLAGGNLPFLPILIDRHAEGLAYTSRALTLQGSDVRWLVSVPSAEPLRDLARRQEILLGVLAASLMVALLVGLVNHRTFVSPIDRVAEHLSAIQMGRGEAELSERSVSGPFRRLVRLINMLVQKLPARAFSASTSIVDSSPISELPPGSMTDDLTTGSVMRPGRPLPLPAPEPIDDFEPADLSTFPPVPNRPSQPPLARSRSTDDEEAAVAEAIASMSLPPVQPSEMDDYGEDDDSASAIAEAIASLEAQQKAAADAGLSAPPSSARSAASIRGGTPAGESPFTPSQSEYLRGGSVTAPRPSPQQKFYLPPEESVTQGGAGVRGGGSLKLDAPAGLGSAALADPNSFGPEETVVAPVQEELLAKSAREEIDNAMEDGKPDATVVASVPADLLAQSAGESMPEGPAGSADLGGLDAADHAHFKQVYERFIDMRRKCGEPTSDLVFDRFLTKLTKNRENLIKKYSCRTVRFQVYEKDGKAALKATPVRAR